MAEAGTTVEKTASKRRIYQYFNIDIGSGRMDVVGVRGDVVDYFNMTGAVAAGSGYKVTTRKTTGRELYVDLSDTTGTASATDTTNRFALPTRLTAAGGGKIITLPTELKTAKGNMRTVRMHFPGKANLASISNFLFTKCALHKPAYFITASGVRRAVVAIPSGDINANEEALTQPAAAG